MNTFIKLLVSGILSLGIIAGVQQNSTSTQLNNKETTQTINSSQEVTSEEAKQIALGAVDGTFQKIVDDNDEYDIYIQKDQYIYEIDVNKKTGKITGIDTEEVKTTTSNTTTQSANKTTSKTNSSTTKSTTSKNITLAKAKQIALKRVNGTIQKTVNDNDEYDIYIKKDSYIYKIEVNKKTGKITDVDKEAIKTTNTTKTTQNTTTSKNITLAKAKQVALKKVNGKIITTKTDSDDYDITIQKGQYVYEIEVNKRTGKITDIDKEKARSTNIISSTKAKQIALKRVNGTVQSVEYDADDCEYAVEIMKNNVEYEVTIHAETGKVLEVEKD